MLKGFRNYIDKTATSSKRLLLLAGLIVGSFILLAIALEILWALLGFPIWQASGLVNAQEVIDLSEVASTVQPLILEGLKAALPGLGGLALSGTAFAAIRNLRVAEDTRKIAEEKQVTDLFVEAVKMLADEKMQIQLGGIYALKRVAENSSTESSSKYQGMVMEVLSSFVRMTSPLTEEEEQTPWIQFFNNVLLGNLSNDELSNSIGELNKELENSIEKPPKSPRDTPGISIVVQAALGVIGGRGDRELKINLRRTHLAFADLKGAELASAELGGVNLRFAQLREANLANAYLTGYLSNANFRNADLSYARLYCPDLRNATFDNANLRYAELFGADLTLASFDGADLYETQLERCNLYKADFRKAKGLAPEQVEKALNWEHAYYAPEFAKQLGLATQDNQDQSVSPENHPDTPS